jgi:transcriptional regulator with XRE-family HTH domain
VFILPVTVTAMLAAQFGAIVKRRRTQLGVSQSALARAAGVSRTVLSKLEGESCGPVQTDILDRLMEALAVSPVVASSPAPDNARSLERLQLRCRLELQRNRHLRLAASLGAGGGNARSLIERARERVRLWEERRSCSPFYIERWNEILSGGPRHVALAMSSLGEWEDALFQNTPWSFAWN